MRVRKQGGSLNVGEILIGAIKNTAHLQTSFTRKRFYLQAEKRTRWETRKPVNMFVRKTAKRLTFIYSLCLQYMSLYTISTKKRSRLCQSETASSLEQKERSKPLPACQDRKPMTSATISITLATHPTTSFPS